MMNQEIIDSGIIRLSRTDFDGFKEINSYNEHVSDCRYKLKRLKEAKYGFQILNPLLLLTMCFALNVSVFENAKLALIILTIQIISYGVTLVKNNYVIHTICSALLIFLDIRFAILFVGNLIIGGIIFFMEKPLKTEPGYPEFSQIYIIYDEADYTNNNIS